VQENIDIKEVLIQTTPLLVERIEHKKFQIKHQDLNLFNPSVTYLNSEKIVIARSSTLQVFDDGKYYGYLAPHDTVNYVFKYDNKEKLTSSALLDDSECRKLKGIADCGIEDIRLFKRDNSIFGVCAGISFLNKKIRATQLLIEIQSNSVVKATALNSPINSLYEKNWTPLVSDEDLYLLYSLDPLICMEIEEEKMSLKKGPYPKSNNATLRGGTPFAKIGNQWLSLAHYPPIVFEQRRYYRHCFILLDKDFNLVERSEPFFIQKRGIEFAAGLAVSGDEVTLSYGVSDRSAFYLNFNLPELDKFLVCV
jgi:predicted GH43/DUF377 family glycosyl hydrolase